MLSLLVGLEQSSVQHYALQGYDHTGVLLCVSKTCGNRTFWLAWMRAPMDDTPMEWSSHPSPNHQQRHRQRDDTEPSAHIPTPLLGIRRAHPPVELGAVGVDTIATARGSKRCRVTTVGLEEGNSGRWKISSARNDWRGFPKQSPNTLGGQPRVDEEKGRARYGGVGEGREGAVEGMADEGGGCCTFRWPDSNNTSDRRGGQGKVISGGLAAATMLEREGAQDCGGTGSALGLGGGCSAELSSGMDVVVGGGGSHETGNGPAEDKNGWRAMSAITGGSAVIASGFVAGGFPGHQWHQDQGGSTDDMLILYGSRS